MKKTKYKSKCCNASVTVCGGNSERLDDCTFHFVCDKCKKACDIKTAKLPKNWGKVK
jgi:hypothetical protein